MEADAGTTVARARNGATGLMRIAGKIISAFSDGIRDIKMKEELAPRGAVHISGAVQPGDQVRKS